MAKKIISLYRSNGLETKVEKLQPPEQIISAEVTEKLNDSLTLSMVCVCTEHNVKYLTIGNTIMCNKDTLFNGSEFTFEIYDVKYSIDGRITVMAEHVSSRLRNIYVQPITKAFSAYELSNILSGSRESGTPYMLINQNHYNHAWSPIIIKIPYEMDDVINGKVMTDSIKSISDIMAGSSGSILDVFGGGFWEHTGDFKMTFRKENYYSQDSEHQLAPIVYSYNMSGFNREIDMDNAKSNQVLFWKKEVDGVVEHVWACNRKFDDEYYMQASQLVDLSSKFETKPTEAQLIAAAPAVSTSPEVTTTCSVTNYEDKKAVCGKKVRVIFPKFNVNEELQIVETVYNVLTDNYKSIKLGTSKKTLSKTIAEIAGKTGTNVY